jgi:NAD(P)-dependent dehydrogenase (short-subunit alcohol dehydrogenase family)
MSHVAIITGASRGIGAATARLAAERGYAVCVNYLRNREAADSLVTEIDRGGGRAIAVRADVSSEPDVVRLFATTNAQLGRVTALVNNAGILERQMNVEQMDAARLGRLFATNVVGCFLCAREAVRRMSQFDYSQGKPNRFASRMKRPVVAVVLESDVAAVFDSSAKVNAQLRSAISARKHRKQPPRVRAHRRKAG